MFHLIVDIVDHPRHRHPARPRRRERALKRGNATEHTHRPALKELLGQKIAPLQVLGAFIVVGAIIATGRKH